MMCLTRHVRNLSALLISGVAILLASPAPMRADPLPTVVGQCSDTTIERIGPRLVGHLESGIGVVYANGGTQVSYEVIAALQRSRRGDRVRLCLAASRRTARLATTEAGSTGPRNCAPARAGWLRTRSIAAAERNARRLTSGCAALLRAMLAQHVIALTPSSSGRSP
jgi:hypothetical protein